MKDKFQRWMEKLRMVERVVVKGIGELNMFKIQCAKFEKKIVKIMFKTGKHLNISSPDVVVTNFPINVLSKFLTSYPSHEL